MATCRLPCVLIVGVERRMDFTDAGAQCLDILYIGFVTGNGGDAFQTLLLAEGMIARGYRCGIIVPAHESTMAFAERCRARGVPVWRSPWVRCSVPSARQNLVHLLRLFHRYRAPILHLQVGDICPPRLALLAMSLLRLPPAFATLHSPRLNLDPAGARARFWAHSVPRRFRRVICPSEHSRQEQLRMGVPEEDLLVVRNGIDIAEFANGDAQAAHRSLNLPSKAQLIVFTARLEEQKRPLDAVAAFQLIAAELPDTHLVFVGTGSQGCAIREASARTGHAARIHFPGFQNNIPDWLAAASVWVLPTEAENFSLAVLEALAAGCPIVSTFCPGNDEVLVDGKNALLTAIGDVAGLAACLRRVLTEPELAASMRTHARRTIRAFSMDRMVEEHLACYGLCKGSSYGADTDHKRLFYAEQR
jgi:glycosyltransferase involved in cell wall biosynthesis